MKIIDTHCHLDLAVFDHDREQIINNCNRIGIDKIIVPAIDRKGWKNLITICDQYKKLLPALGLHPVFIDEHSMDDIDLLDEYVDKYKPVAIGEIGLDFYIKDTDKEKQKKYFEMQLVIAEKHNLPVILHVRKAHDTVLNILKTKKITGGSCHAFSGSIQQARKYIEMGFKLGFGGTLTYPNARKIHQLAKEISLEDIILETDAPDMTGYKHKGKRNQPDYITDTLKSLANLKQIDQDIVADLTSKNASELFNI